MAVAPTRADFLLFIRNVMGINTVVLPDNSIAIDWALSVSVMIVNPLLAGVSSPAGFTPVVNLYVLAVYNLGGDNLINYAPDQSGQTYFADLRRDWNITGFAAGVVQSTSDVSTSMSLVVPEQLKTLTLSDLQNLKTPYGRQYLAMAQRYGVLWGLT